MGIIKPMAVYHKMFQLKSYLTVASYIFFKVFLFNSLQRQRVIVDVGIHSLLNEPLKSVVNSPKVYYLFSFHTHSSSLLAICFHSHATLANQPDETLFKPSWSKAPKLERRNGILPQGQNQQYDVISIIIMSTKNNNNNEQYSYNYSWCVLEHVVDFTQVKYMTCSKTQHEQLKLYYSLLLLI